MSQTKTKRPSLTALAKAVQTAKAEMDVAEGDYADAFSRVRCTKDAYFEARSNLTRFIEGES